MSAGRTVVPEDTAVPERPAAPAASVRELPGGRVLVEAGGERFLVPAACPHRKGRLRFARVNARTMRLTCPLHHACFDLRTGERVSGPECGPLQVTRLPAPSMSPRRRGRNAAGPDTVAPGAVAPVDVSPGVAAPDAVLPKGPGPAGPASVGALVTPGPARTARPREFAWIWHSAQFSFGTVVLGAVPVGLGLGWWATVTAVLVGLLAGTAVFAPLVRIGLRIGLGDPESSSAQFGLRGRVLTHVITILVSLVFFTIAIWTGASAVLAAVGRLFGTSATTGGLALAVPVVAAGVLLVAVFGHEIVMRVYRPLAVVGAVVLAGLVAVLAGTFDPSFPGSDPVAAASPATWLLAASFAATLQGDYAASLDPATPPRRAMAWTGVSMFTSNAIALLVGAAVTIMITAPDAPWVIGMADLVPPWFAPVVVVFGIVGTVPQAGLCLHAAGLALGECTPLGRVPAVLAAATTGLGTVYLGTVVWDTISALVPVLLVLVSPWAAIMLVGHRAVGGRYAPDELDPVTGPRSRYWFTAGVHRGAFAAYLPSVLCGLLLLDNPLVHGPLAGVAGGVDISWLVPFTLAAALYALVLRAGTGPKGTPA